MKSRRHRRALIETFESRILYSADPGPAGIVAAVLAGSAHPGDGTTAIQQGGTELVFVDARVPDVQQLLDDLSAQQQAGRPIEVVLVGSDEDGIGVIGSTLAGRSDVSAVHVVGHGASGVAQLGASALDAGSVFQRAGEIAAWGDALSADADLLLYGCDVGEGDAGQSLVTTLAQLTGADVAASDDPTGSALLGGDWDLEVRTGMVEATPFASANVQAEWTRVLALTTQGSETLVNTTTTGTQTENWSAKTVAMDANGNYVVIWMDGSGATDTGIGIYGQRFNASGVAQGAQFHVNTYTADNQRNPTVAMDASGNFVVVWESSGQDGSSYGIYAQRYNSSGVAQGSEFRVNTTTTYDQIEASVAMDANGNFVIAWQSWSQDLVNTNGIYAQRYNSSGVAQGSEFLVNTYTTESQTEPSVAMDAAGNFVIAWQSFGQDGDNEGIYAKRYNSSGVVQGSEFHVSTYTTSNQDLPVVAMDSTGNFVVVWESNQDGSGNGIYGQRYNSSGAAQGSEFRINTTTTNQQQNPVVTMLAGGAFAVTWQSTAQDGSFDGVYMRQYDSSGTALTAETLVNTTTTDYQDVPSIAADEKGHLVVVWHGNGSGDSDGIFMQRYVYAVAPVLTLTSYSGTYVENAGVIYDAGATVTDADTTTFTGGQLVYQITANGTASDELGIRNQGTGAGLIGLSGTNVTYGGTTIGTYSGSFGNGSTPLTVTFNSNASVAAVQALVRNVTYRNTSDNPSTATRTISLTVSDGTGMTSTPAVVSMAVTAVNDAPIVTSAASASVAENTTTVMTVTSSDVDGGTPVYSISGGVDAAKFTINSTGALSFAAAPDYETPTDSGGNNVYDVTVQVSDGAGGTATQAIAVTVTDVSSALIVTTTADTNDTGLGSSFTAEQLNASKGADGRISLREAIIAANTTAGTDTISFNIPDALVSGTHTIKPTTALPTLTGAVIIDGTTEPDYVVGRPVVEIDGSLTGSGVNGLVLGAGAGGSTIRGLAINSFNSGSGYGLYLMAGADGNVIEGNIIGLDADGTTAVPTMSNFGVYVASSGNTIGGTTTAARNVLSNNINAGVALYGSNNLVIGNYIGTDATGTLDRGNFYDGVSIFGGTNNRVGGTTAAERNIISGNDRQGIEIGSTASGTLIQGNYIGTDHSGSLSLGNAMGGIWVGVSATGVTIGGTAAGAGNLIVNNPTGGIYTDTSSVSFSLLGNTFYNNTNLAIDLKNDGVTANDASDADTGPNSLQNFPVITSARIDGAGHLAVVGTLASSASSYYRIEFYANATQDASGYGEGQRYLGYVNVATNGAGNASFNTVLAVSMAVGESVTATATKSNVSYSSYTDTSEFAADVLVSLNQIPVVTTTGSTLAYTENGTATAVDSALTVSDSDSPNLSGATVSITSGFASGQDTLAFTDQSGITGSWSVATGVLTLSGSASVASYQAALRSITYVNTAEQPSTATRTVSFAVTDGLGTSTAATRNISVASVDDAPSFNAADFTVTTAPGSAADRGYATTIQPDGKILVAGYSSNGSNLDFLLMRYNADGTLDTSFGGGDGIVTTAIGSSDDEAHAVALQSDGRIVVAGFTTSGIQRDFALVRYLADGTLDTTFGGGDGIVTTDIGSSSTDEAWSMVVQTDGRIVLGGNSAGDFAVVRYLADGSLDTSFSGDGKATVDLAAATDTGYGLALQSDGKLVQSGSATVGATLDFGVVRYNTDGSLDTSFGGGDGIVTTPVGSSFDIAQSVAVQSDGRIVVGGYSTNGSNNDFAVIRYTSAGAIDTGFGGGDGITTVDFGGHDASWSTALQSDGRIVMVGGASSSDLAAVRLLSDGSLDTSFSGDGKFSAYLGTSSFLYSAAIGADGRVVATGYSNTTTDDVLLVRLSGDGQFDSRSNPATTSLGGSASYTENASAVVIDSSVRLFDTELNAADSYAGATLTLARSGGANAQDVFSASGNLGTLTQGGSLLLSGVNVGTVTTNSSGTLLLTFNASATQLRINEVMSSIAYANASDAPPASVTLSWTFSDGNAGGQGAGGAKTATGSSTINITAVNDAPVITSSASTSVAENTTAVITVTATDPDSGAPSYSIVGAADAAKFTINSSTGVLSFVSAPDYEAPTDAGANNVYNLSVQVSDGSATAVQAISVTVTDVASTLIVDTTADTNDTGLGSSFNAEQLNASKGTDGRISLREAIIAANTTAGLNTISFNIAGTGPHSIALASALPTVTDAVIIDGTTEPDYAGAPVVVLDGNATVNEGLTIEASNSTVRGLVINNFAARGVLVTSGAANTLIAGNYIGTDATGLVARGNGSWGVDLIAAGTGTVIGGTTALDRNVIAGNVGQGGIAVNGTQGATIIGNYIGVGADGSAALGNMSGILLLGDTTGTRIGGVVAGAGNVIANNAGEGVMLWSATSHAAILGNAFYNNAGQAIDLNWNETVEANDVGDADTGPNQLQNFPVISSAITNGATQIIIAGSLNSEASGYYRIEFFSDTAADSNGYGEGRTYLGSTHVVTDASGNASFNVTLSGIVAGGASISATATRSDATYTSFSQTSEFAASITAAASNIAPAGTTGTVTATEDTTYTFATSDFGFTDPDGNALLRVWIDSLPAAGTLRLNGSTFGAGTGILASDISAGRLTYQPLANSNTSTSLTFRVQDDGGTVNGGQDTDASANTLTIAITAVNDAPVITSSATASVAENTTAVMTVTATDVDLPAQTLSYSIVGGADAARFSINASTGDLSFATAPNYESPTDAGANNVYDVTVQVSDGTLTSTQAIAVSVTPVNDNTPTITSNGGGASASVSIAENTLIVTSVTATDADLPGDTLTYDISGGVDAAKFTIDSNTGVLQFIAAPDYENPTDSGANNVYNLTVRVSDGTNTDTQTIAVTVTNVASELIVTTAADTADGNTSSIANLIANKGADGKISLREAITAANNTAGADTITFAIGSGAQTINLTSALPTITSVIHIEGDSQAGFTGEPVIVLNGASAGAGTIGLLFSGSGAAGSSVKYLAINNFTASGIRIENTSNVTVAGNYLGTNLAGSAAAGNEVGVVIYNASNNLIGGTTVASRNVISGNTVDGVQIFSGGATGNVVSGNYIGLDATGTVDLGNASQGVAIFAGATYNTIGGTTAGARNVISGNNGVGVRISESGTNFNTISGNYIGTNAAGNAAIGNTLQGVQIDTGSGNVIGGTVAGAGNVISGNLDNGILITNGGVNNYVQGNIIGLDESGTTVIANGQEGVEVTGGANGTWIGGTTSATRNIISGNTWQGIGVYGATTTGTVIRGNWIGVAADGTTARGNEKQGILVSDATNTMIGGSNAGEGNIIANAGVGHQGVVIAGASTGAVMIGNSIYASSGLGIDLGGDWITANDTGDADTGANNLQNTPVLTSAATTGSAITITGTLNSVASTHFRIEFFANPAPDSSGYGEGQTYLGFVDVLTDASGNASFSPTITAAVPTGEVVTATATRLTSGMSFVETSEFAADIYTNPPAITSNGGGSTAAVSVAENTTAVTTVTATDPDGAAQTLTYSLVGGTDQGRFQINSSTGALSFLVAPNFEAPTDADSNNVYEVIVQVADGTGATDTQTINVTVTNANDAPVISFVSGNANYPENAGPVLVAASATVTDEDGGNFDTGRLVVQFTANGQAEDRIAIRNQGTGAGQIGISGSNVTYGGVVIGTWTGGTSGSTPLIVTFNASANAAAAQALGRNITYENVSDNPSTAVRTMAGYLEDGDGGTSNTASGTITMVPANDAPTITSAATANVAENTTVVLTVTSSDPDGGTPVYSIVGGADAAKFSINSTTGALSFQSAPDFEAPTDTGGNNVYDVTVQAADGAGGTTSQAIAVTVTNVNEAPVVTITPATYAATEQITLTLSGTGLSIADADAGAATLRATLSVVSGALTVGVGTTGVTVVSGSGSASVVLEGSQAQLNDLLAGNAGGTISYLFGGDAPPATDTLTLNVNDLGSTGSGGAASGADSATINLTAVNDAPVNTVPGAQATSVNTALTFGTATSNPIAISDADAASATMQVSLTITNGTFTLASTAGLSFTTGDGTGDAAMTFTGTIAAINAALDGASFIPTTAYSGDASIALVTSDLGNTGGGALTDSDTIHIQVGASRFQEGVGGYTGTQDTYVQDTTPTTAYGSASTVLVDDGSPQSQGLLRFDNLFGSGVGQIPFGATITSASLSFYVTNHDAADTVYLYRMFSVWTEASTWNSLDSGIQTNDAEAGTSATLSFSAGVSGWNTVTGLQSTVQAWADGATNNGWAFLSVSPGADNWTFASSEYATVSLRPYLVINYEAPIAPVITSNGGGASAAVSIAENTSAVTTVTATDADSTPSELSYSIVGGADAAKFTINGSTGALSFLAAPNYEAPTDSGSNNIYDVTVQVSDGFLTDTQAIAVTVTPTNDNTPAITSSATASVAENTTAVLTVTATDADLPVQTLTYSIVGGADAANFSINSSTGALSFVTAPDYESPTDSGGNNVYDVTIQASDGTLTSTQAIAVTVTPVNDDTPTITSSTTASVTENSTAVMTVTATDADLPAQTLSYSIVGGADAAKFSINSATGALSFVTAPDFEVPTDAGGNDIYDVTVQVSDGTLTSTQAIAVTVTPVNDNTPAITSSATANVAENTTAVLTVTSTDTDLPAQTLSYSIVGGADTAKFAIDSATGALSFLAAPDFEAPTDAGANNIYDVTVQVSDGTLTSTQAIVVTVTPVNDNTPAITSGATASVAENTTAVMTVTATDVDLPAQTLSYSIVGGADAAKFAINASTGALSFVIAPDFEVPTDAGGNNIYDVTVQVSDGALTSTQAIAVTVTPVNDNTPAITSSATASVAENTTSVLTVTATDADQPVQTLSYSIVGGSDAAKFSINSATGALSFVTAPDYEAPTDSSGNNIYDVTVQVSDGALTSTQAIAVTITPVNDNTPAITSSATASVAENTTAVMTVTATDADLPAQTLSYSIVGGADAAKFSINSSTGALSFLAAPDFEAPTDAGANNIYDVTVQVSDGTLTSTQAIAVTVTPVNDDTPTITSSATASVAENSTAVMTVTATDADLPAQTLSYSIVGGADAAKFSINASTGALSFVTAPDYEAPTDGGGDDIYDVTVQVSDGTLTSTQAIAVTVTPVNDNTPAITSSATASVAENTTSVLTVTATDADQPVQTLSYSIVGGSDAAKFSINSATGALSFVTAPDYEAPTDSSGNNIYDVTVRVSDGTLTSTQAIAVTVTPVNDSTPAITSGATATVAENTTAVMTVTATDADLPAQTLSYSIVGGADAAKFSISSSTGALSFLAAPDFEVPTDAGANNVYDVTVQVSDGALTSTQAIAVTVTPVNDNTPAIISSTTASVAENTTAVLTVAATDADLPAQTLSYSIVGGADAAKFTIDSSTGALSFVTAPDYEAPTDSGGNNIYDVTVQVSDGTLTTTQAIAVTVTSANDNTPSITSSATANVAENSTAVLTVTATDADLPAQTLSYSIVGGADAAKFTIDSATGALSFLAAPDYEAPTDSGGNNIYDVTVQASDGTLTSTQAIAVTVTPVNDNTPAITSSATANVAENSTAVLTVTATDADLPAQTLSYSIVGGADAAKFTINSSTGALSFVTAPDYEAPTDSGANNIYDLTVQVSDGTRNATMALAITVTNRNEMPQGSTGRVTVAEDVTHVFAMADFGFADPLDASANSLADVQIVTVPTRGNLTLDGAAVADGQWIAAADIAAGRLRFAAVSDENGTAYASLAFRVRDDGGTVDGGVDTESGSHVLTIDVSPVNDSPVAHGDAYSLDEDTPLVVSSAGGLLANDGDIDGDALSAGLLGGPAHGSLSLAADGSFVYTPDADWFGADSFIYRAIDGSAVGAPVTVSLVVRPVNDAPTIARASLQLIQGGSTVLAADAVSAVDVDSAAGDVVFVVDSVSHGHFELQSAPGVAVGQFSYAALAAGKVVFVHESILNLPVVVLHPSDGLADGAPLAASVGYSGTSVLVPPGGSGGSEAPVVVVPPVVIAPTTPTVPATNTPKPAEAAKPATPPASTPVIRPDTAATLEGDSAAISVTPAVGTEGADAHVRRYSAENSSVRFGNAQITLSLGASTQGPLMEFMLGVADTSQANASSTGTRQSAPEKAKVPPLGDDAYADVRVVLNAVELSGIALSVGAVWWATRAGGLVASLLMAAPAWRTFDPLPVLGPRDEEEGDWGEMMDDEMARDEEGAADVFDEHRNTGARG